MNDIFELEFELKSKNKWPLVASVFQFEPFKSYFPILSPFSSWCQSDVCLYAYPGSPYISNAPCLVKPSIDRIWQKKNFTIHKIHEGRNPNSNSQTLKISTQPTSLWKECLKKINTSSPYICQLYTTIKVHSLWIYCLNPPTSKCQRLSFH